MKPIDKPFRYSTAAESAQPGYLARKFAQLRKEQRREREERDAKVRPMSKRIAGDS